MESERGMEAQKNADPLLCVNGCGFYGSVQNSNLCSKCHNEYKKERLLESNSSAPRSPPKLTPSTPQLSSTGNSNFFGSNIIFGKPSSFNNSGNPFFDGSTKNSGPFTFSFSSNNASPGSFFATSHKPVSNVNFTFGASTGTNVVKRCSKCNKRVGLTGFRCRCESLFCGKHRYPEEHECDFDYKAAGRELLLKQNPLCKGDNDKLQNRI